MNQAWGRVVEGWRQLHERASQAMTRFIPSAPKTEAGIAQASHYSGRGRLIADHHPTLSALPR
jgi:hypothetical protein